MFESRWVSFEIVFPTSFLLSQIWNYPEALASSVQNDNENGGWIMEKSWYMTSSTKLWLVYQRKRFSYNDFYAQRSHKMAGTIDLRAMASYSGNFCIFSSGCREIGRRNFIMVDSVCSFVCVRWMRGLLHSYRFHKTLFDRWSTFSGKKNGVELITVNFVVKL